MHRKEILTAIQMRYGSQAELARILRVSSTALSLVISGGMRSRPLEGVIANILGKPLSEVFPDRYPKSKDTKKLQPLSATGAEFTETVKA